MADTREIGCACGKARLRLRGRPIMSVECHCDSCRKAALRLETLPSAPALMEANGGTREIMYRKDRVDCISGADLLREFRLAPDAKTRRIVASCCNAPMFLEFSGGHWLSLYARRWREAERPPVELRTMVGDRAPEAAPLDGDVPNLKGHSFAFFARLLGAWIAMGFRVPKLTYVRGTIDAKA